MIEFRDVHTTPGSTEILYDLLRERQGEDAINISHVTTPSFEDHEAFVQRRPYWLWFLVYSGETCVGTISVTNRNEIGICIFKAHRQKGYAAKTLEKLLSIYEPQPPLKGERIAGWVANINPENKRSIRLFKSLGFTLTQHTYTLP